MSVAIDSSQRVSERNLGLIALASTALIHLLGLLIAALLISLSSLFSEPPKVLDEPEKENIVALTPDFFKRVVEPPPPVVDEKRFARTTEDQLSETPPEETRYIGERNTLSASELDPTDVIRQVPTLEGETPKQEEQIETFTEQFSDGEVESGVGEASPSSLAVTEAPQEELLEKPVEKEKQSSRHEVKKFLETERALERTKEKLEPSESEAEPHAHAESPSSGAPTESEIVGDAEKRSAREVKKTTLQGSIKRRGKSSLAVQKTALGRYQAAVGRAVEREWQKNCLQYREHIVPGYLTVRFVLDAKGTVTQLDFVESSQSGGIQNGFTLSAIQNASIPAMPKELIAEQGGTPIDMIFSFSF